MSDTEDDWDAPDPEYFNEVAVCRHGMHKRDRCEWCEDEREEQE